MEKNKELVKQMEELNCQVVKQQEQNAAKIAQLEEHNAVMNKENAALVIQIDEERALKQDTMEKLNSIIEKRDKEVKAIAYKIHTTELDELTKAQAEFNKLKREYREQILLRDGKIKMLEEQMAAPVRPEPQMAALVASEAQVNALTPQQNINSEEDRVVEELAPEKEAIVEKIIKEIKENYCDPEVLENAVHRMNKTFMRSPNSYIKRLKNRTGRKNTKIAEYHYTPLKKQTRKGAELNVESFKAYEPPVAMQQTTNDEHKEHSDDQKKEMEAIDFIPTEYRVMVTTILKDESRILVWAGEELDNYVYDDDFRFLMLDDALTCGLMKLKEQRTDVLKDSLAAAMQCTFIHFPLLHCNHWTLLVLNTLNGRWDLYNSLAKLNKKHADRAKQLANQIANDINGLIPGTIRITNKVRTVRATPQQHPDSYDCGVIVCYLMNRISRNKEIDPNLSRQQCIRFRAKIVVKLLSDRPRSWNPEDNEDSDFDI
ncbi:hypothetical protein RHMOL_Rhmol09G0260700 [Rhododendron molle]|uniref:Uncharacterized protein n=1 Tax=Rhododendron molle TaxID=49168 RepID=A0ACC0MJ77_RHOML|nr:hypothetical protein RHMOL_Rhmol09G0260700 [Rhododendron molle]